MAHVDGFVAAVPTLPDRMPPQMSGESSIRSGYSRHLETTVARKLRDDQLRDVRGF
jgi:hypothetical protein